MSKDVKLVVDALLRMDANQRRATIRIAELEQALDRAMDYVRAYEWSATDECVSANVCPDCGEFPDKGHEANCELDAFLRAMLEERT